MAHNKYHLHLKGYVGGYDFDSDYVDYVLGKHPEEDVHVLIDSLGGSLATALSIVAAFRNHGNVHVHFVGMNASAATIAPLLCTWCINAPWSSSAGLRLTATNWLTSSRRPDR